MSDRVTGVVPGGIDPRALPELTQRAHSAYRMAGIVTGTFLVAGLSWVFLTDVILYAVQLGSRLRRARRDRQGMDLHRADSAAAVRGHVPQRGAPRSGAASARRRWSRASPTASCSSATTARIAYANPAAVKMLRCSREELIGMGAAGVLAPLPRFVPERRAWSRPSSSYRSACSTKAGRSTTRRSFIHRAATTWSISATAAGVRHGAGRRRPTWVVSVMHDITDTDRPGAAARPVLRRRGAFAQDAGRRHQGGRAGAAARLDRRRSAAADGLDRAPVRPHRPARAEPARAVAGALADAAAFIPASSSCARCIERIVGRARLVIPRTTSTPRWRAHRRGRATPERLALAIRNLIVRGESDVARRIPA